MAHLVPYAGFDPHENEFDDVELAPLHDQDVARRPRSQMGHRTRLDLGRIRHLRGLGWSWRAVGEQLAIEAGRPVPYLGTSIRWAVRYATPRVTSC